MHTGNPLTTAEAVHTFAMLDTNKQATILTREGESYATDELLTSLKRRYPRRWAPLVVRLNRAARWGNIPADDVRLARTMLGLNRAVA